MLTRRPAGPCDVAFARAAHHAAYRAVVERQFGAWDDERQDEFFAADWRGATFEILEWDGEPCGYTSVESRDADLHVRELVVHPDHQGLGIGTGLLRQTMAEAERRGVPVHLATLIRNEALHLYERLGFVEVDRDATHVVLRWTPAAR